jgi:Tfp pilus assembly protein PilW
MKKYFTKNNTAGYTIIETMIAVSVFLVVIISGMGALLNASLLHQKAENMRSIMDNLSFIMEDMSRNMRTGYDFHCFIAGDIIPSITSDVVSVPKSCANGWAIAFESATGAPSNDGVSDAKDNDQWVYYIGSTVNADGTTTGKIFRSTAGPYTVSSFVQLTPDEVVIDPISSFAVLGAEVPPGDKQQPLITIRLVGKITVKGVVTPFSLQTSVSERQLDI